MQKNLSRRETGLLIALVFAFVAILAFVVAGIARDCQSEEQSAVIQLMDEPLIRAPGEFSDYHGPVEVVVPKGYKLLVVFDPGAGTVLLPSSSTWVAAAAIDPNAEQFCYGVDMLELMERE